MVTHTFSSTNHVARQHWELDAEKGYCVVKVQVDIICSLEQLLCHVWPRPGS